MELKEGMIVKIVRITNEDDEDEDLLEYIGKIGIIYNLFHDDLDVVFDIGDYNTDNNSFFKNEVKIVGFDEKNNMFENYCIWCKIKNKKHIVSHKSFNIIIHYCPKCLR